jgi:hypothetical protein
VDHLFHNLYHESKFLLNIMVLILNLLNHPFIIYLDMTFGG